MAPRREEEDEMVVIGEETALSRSPTSIASDRFIKSLSNLSLEEDSPPLDSNKEDPTAKAALAASLNLISERGERLLARVCDMINDNDSIIVEACRSSLQSEFLFMLDEAQLLLDNMDNGNADCPITSWRVSLAQIRADAYLESIQTALVDCPDQANKLNMELFHISSSIALQLENEQVDMRISPWNLSSLALDVTVGTPVQHVLEGDLPLNMQVRAVQEIQAKDTMDGNNKASSYRACKLYVERCVHQVGSFRAGAGSVGDVLVTVRVSPIVEETNDGCCIKSARTWETDGLEDTRPVVKEARNVQVNAFPPSPKSTVDLYVSHNHGDSDTTITLRFPTYKTLNKAIPDVRVELVMG